MVVPTHTDVLDGIDGNYVTHMHPYYYNVLSDLCHDAHYAMHYMQCV